MIRARGRSVTAAASSWDAEHGEKARGGPPMPGWILWFFVVGTGACIGSFLNVCIHRLPRHLSIVHPRSACPGCGTPIAWYDNIPVLSYLLLRGRCRRCATRISPRYPLVEISTALLFA